MVHAVFITPIFDVAVRADRIQPTCFRREAEGQEQENLQVLRQSQLGGKLLALLDGSSYNFV